MSKINVIVPVYKVEAYLNRCVDSILSQTYSDFELILVDDGSPDNCGTICDEYAGKDSRVTVIHQENGGLSAARNAGIEYALQTGSEWLTFIDSDDWIHPEHLNYLYSAAVEQSTEVSVCGFQRTSGEEAEIGDTSFRIYSPEELWCGDRVNATVAWGKLYRKRLFDTVRYPAGKIHEDEFTTYKLLFACDRIAVTKAKTYYYYQNPIGIMQSEWNPKRLAAAEAFEGQLSYFSQNNCRSALIRSAVEYLHYLSDTYKTTSHSDQYRRTARKLMSDLRKGIRKYKKVIPLTAEKHYQILSVAYPFETCVHNYMAAIKRGVSEFGFFGYIKRKIKSLISG